MQKETWTTVLKGVCVGGSMTVPGVSGGSMAMILGIYDRLIASISSLSKDFRGNLSFLLRFLLGSALGMALFANPLLALIERCPRPMLFFFIGAVAGGVPMILKKAQVRSLSAQTVLCPLAGAACVLALSLLPEGLFQAQAGLAGLLLEVAAGVVAAVALVLPGISVSYMLLMMGLYDRVLQNIAAFNVPALLPLAAGLLLGILATTRTLERAMNRFPRPTYLLILGFVLGSVAEVFPGLPVGAAEWVICPLMAAGGYCAIDLMTRGSQARAARSGAGCEPVIGR